MRTLCSAHELFDVAAARDLVEGDLLLHDFVGGVDEDLQHVDLLLDLPRELVDLSGVGAHDDREFVDARERRFGGREALDVDIAAGEDRGDLAQQTHLVLRKYGDDIFLFHTLVRFIRAGSSDTGAPAGTIGKTFSSLSTRTSSR